MADDAEVISRFFDERCRKCAAMTDFEIDRARIEQIDREEAARSKSMFRALGRSVFDFHEFRLTAAISNPMSSMPAHSWLNYLLAQVAKRAIECKSQFPGAVMQLFVGPTKPPRMKTWMGCYGFSTIELLIEIAERTLEAVSYFRPPSPICDQSRGRRFWYTHAADGSLIDASQPSDIEAVNAALASWLEILPSHGPTKHKRVKLKKPKNTGLLAYSRLPENEGKTDKEIVAGWNLLNPGAGATEQILRKARSRDKGQKM